AATVAGVMDLDDALRLVLVRGQVMQAQPGGSMLAAAGPVERLRTLLPADATAVVMAAVNTPDQAVLAGPTRELAEAAQVLGAAGIVTRPLRTSHAFHTPAMRPAAEAFLASFAGMALRPPALPVYSAATGKLLTGEQATSPAFWAGQLTDPVLFSSAVEAVTEVSGGRFLLEVGPGRALTRLALRHPAVPAAQWRGGAPRSPPPRPGRPPMSRTCWKHWPGSGCAASTWNGHASPPTSRCSGFRCRATSGSG